MVFANENDFWLVVGLFSLLGLAIGYLFAWLRRPQMWAYILRKVTKKNWCLLLLRVRGGQVVLAPVLQEGSRIDYGQMTFVTSDEFTNYFGSVACYAFDAEDCSPILFRKPKADDLETLKKARDPQRIKGLIMLIKALYQAMREDEMFNKIILGLVILGVIMLLVGLGVYFTYAGQSRMTDFLAQSIAQNPCFAQNANLTSQLTSMLK